MLDLEPRVELDEVEGAVRAEQELEGARVAVADRLAGSLGGSLHLLAAVRAQRRRRRLLDQLLVPPLDRALALAERQHAPLSVGEHLDLDVTRRRDGLLEVEAAVAEGGLGLQRRGRERCIQVAPLADEPHPLAAAARRRLEQHRIAGLLRGIARLVQRRRPLRARDDRDVRRAHLRLRLDLVAHARHHLGARADEHQVVVGARRHEGRVLGEEAPARVDGLAGGGGRRRDQRRDAEVAFRRLRRTDADGPVREPHVERVLVGGRVDGDGLDVQLVQRANHAHGDLASVRDENALEHG